MIASFPLLLWVLCISVPAYWALPASWSAARLILVSIVSALLIFILSPLILSGVLIFGLCVVAFALAHRANISRQRLRLSSWAIFSLLLVPNVFPAEVFVAGLLGNSALSVPTIIGFTYLGLSYTAIRSFLIIRECIEGRAGNVVESLSALLFFGSFVAGPIAGSTPWRDVAPRLSGEAALLGLARIGWGGAMFLILRQMVEDAPVVQTFGLAADGVAASWIGVFQNFLALYIDFSGYSHIAIGCGLLYGVRLPENFRWPLRATSIQEFWQRWHLSLAAFVGTYLFKPLVRATGRPSLAIFVAFVSVGIWHEISLPYLIWGIGHGGALALNMIWNRAAPLRGSPAIVHGAAKFAGWAITLTYVALLSNVANAGSMSDAISLVQALTGN